MERIAPLAKILAEANGIEWEHLKGTGAGGMIIEQDILDYLSRVMSGEAEPPATPVDAPPPDWNGEDIPGGGMFDANMLSQAGVESDIADFVQQSRTAPASTPAQPEPTPALSQDDFELDDDTQDDDLLAPPVAPAAAAPSAGSPFDIPPVAPAAAAPAPVQPAPMQSAEVTPPAPKPAAAGGLGNLLSRLYHKDDQPAAPTPSVPEVRPGSSFGGSDFGSDSVAAPAASSPFNVPPVQLHQDEPEVAAPAPSFTAPAVTEPEPAVPAATYEPEPVQEPEAAEPVTEPEVIEPEVTESVVTEAEVEAEEVRPVADESDVQPVAVEVEEEQAVAQPVVEESIQDEQPAEKEQGDVPAVVPAVAVAPVGDSSAPRDAVWFGTYLRRDAQVAQLHDLRQQLSEALEREVPLSLLVARAAQRHAAGLGLSGVAMRDMSRGVSRQMGGQVGNSVSLRDALMATDQEFEGTPDLLVVDAGALDMDDLHYPDTLTLSVGRVQDGRAALSLQGDVDPEKAARFLASVAQTLEKPVILLV